MVLGEGVGSERVFGELTAHRMRRYMPRRHRGNEDAVLRAVRALDEFAAHRPDRTMDQAMSG